MMTTEERKRVSKREFISRVAARSGYSRKVVKDVYEAIFGEITAAVREDESVVLNSFGRFYRQDHKGHKVRFGKSRVDSYPVLKFSASPSVRLTDQDEDGELAAAS